MENILSTKTEFINKSHQPKCGIIMPISGNDSYPKEHWLDVLQILKDVAEQAGFEPNLVSDADEVSVIQKTIVQNLYKNEIVVCDVSSKNPNVMFELGLRLAFDKPTIIVKDNLTDFTFDTGIIEHLQYPRDLRFNSIIIFKEVLKNKICKTHERAVKDATYTTFLKNFGEFKVAQLNEKTVSSDEYIINAIEQISRDIKFLKNSQSNQRALYGEANEIGSFARTLASNIYKHYNECKAKSSEHSDLPDLDTFIDEHLSSLNSDDFTRNQRSALKRNILIELRNLMFGS